KNKISQRGLLELNERLILCNRLKNLTLYLSIDEETQKKKLDQDFESKNTSNLEQLTLVIKSLFFDIRIFNLGSQLAKHTQLISLILELNYANLQNEGVSSLGQGIAKCQNLQIIKLYLRVNSIFDEGIADLAKGFAECQQISNFLLDLRYNSLRDQAISDLCIGLSKLLNLKNLKMYLRQIFILLIKK
ncbi:hypothetical protein ABPG73_018956, partial [Tetrahymena malaccensis]